jgi:hypothetical protein
MAAWEKTMRRLSKSTWILIVLLESVAIASQARDLPAGWFRAGSNPADYEMAVDPSGGRNGAAAFIKSRTAAPTVDGFGTLMQQFTGEEYRGKRLRLSGYVKASGISNWSGLWMRVDGPDKTTPLAFDNMQGRPIKGTQDWRRYEIVLDVPPTATSIAFGILLAGPGQAWIDDLQFEVVGATVPTTNLMGGQPTGARGPSNLNFDK